MITHSLSTSTANLYAPLNPVGQKPIGQEDSSSRITTTKPVEQLSSSGRQTLRTRDRELEQRVDLAQDSPSGIASDDAESDNTQAGNEEQRENQSRAEQRREQAQEREEQLIINDLSARDREVRAHEQAHSAVGGQYAGAPSYEFKRGPDGVNYAIGGEVSIDTSPEQTPEQTIRKAQIVRRAALAPAEPSPQDRSVAAQATQMESQAQRDLAVQRREQAEAASEARTENQEDADEAPSGLSPENASGNTSSSAAPTGLSTNGNSSNTISSLQTPASNSYVASRLQQSIANTSPNAISSGSILNQIA